MKKYIIQCGDKFVQPGLFSTLGPRSTAEIFGGDGEPLSMPEQRAAFFSGLFNLYCEATYLAS